jgi:hypothetical protein
VPDDIEDSLAPLLLDVIGTSGHAVRFVSRIVPPGEVGPVLVTGAGPVGLGVVLALKSMGYHDIRVADPNKVRLGIAQSFGAKAHPVGDTSQRFALIVECSGAHAARNLGIEVVLPRGALVTGRRERRALDHRGRQGVPAQGFLHDPHLLFPDWRLRAEHRAAAPLQGRVSRAGRRRIRPAGPAAEFRALCRRRIDQACIGV